MWVLNWSIKYSSSSSCIHLIWLVDVFSTYTRHSHEYQLWSSSGRLVPLFTWGRLHAENEKKTPLSFNFLFRYIGSTLSLINSKFDVYVDHIYPIELEIKDSTDSARPAWYTPKKLAVRAGRNLRQKRWFQISHGELSIYM